MAIESGGIAPTLFAKALDIVQRNKLRPTFTRIATMAILLEQDEPMVIDAIYNRLVDTGQEISRASVYRALKEFCKSGLAMQGWEDIETGRMVYARAPEHLPLTSYELHCRGCGRRMLIEDKFFAHQLYYHARQHGFDKNLNTIRIDTLCNDCKE